MVDDKGMIPLIRKLVHLRWCTNLTRWFSGHSVGAAFLRTLGHLNNRKAGG